MRREKIVLPSASGIDMTGHQEESRLLELEIGIDIHDGIVADLRQTVTCLNSELSQRRTVVGGIIAGEITQIGPQVAFQHTRNLKAQIEIGVDIESGNGQNSFLARLLPGHDTFPMNRAEGNILIQFSREQIDGCTAFTVLAVRVKSLLMV